MEINDRKNSLNCDICRLTGKYQYSKKINDFYKNRFKKYLKFGLIGTGLVGVGVLCISASLSVPTILSSIGLFVVSVPPIVIGSLCLKEVYDKVNYFKGYNHHEAEANIKNDENIINSLNAELKNLDSIEKVIESDSKPCLQNEELLIDNPFSGQKTIDYKNR